MQNLQMSEHTYSRNQVRENTVLKTEVQLVYSSADTYNITDKFKLIVVRTNPTR